ncbi:MAG: V-type ATP synthase subunit F [Clostridia bacterium]|nr:V-type ATP synthase subunit F [Clostridia bacterium]
MYKVSVLGDRESVLGFKALGFNAVAVDDAETAREKLHELAEEDTAIIYITEQLAVKIKDDIDRYKDDVRPAIILIPGKDGTLGIGMNGVHATVERAVGADILDN